MVTNNSNSGGNNGAASGNLLQVPPQTPRASSHRRSGSGSGLGGLSGSGITPSFSFGLGFLPSFQFNSPRNLNLVNSFSPHRFFHSSNELLKVVSSSNGTSSSFNKSGGGLDASSMPAPANCSSHKKNNSIPSAADIFNSLTPPNSSKSNQNKFMDSLTSSVKKEPKSPISIKLNQKHDFDSLDHNDSMDSKNDMDIWSLANDDSNSQNLTINRTSIYEDETTETPKRKNDNSSRFLTPNKLMLNTKPIINVQDVENPESNNDHSTTENNSNNDDDTDDEMDKDDDNDDDNENNDFRKNHVFDDKNRLKSAPSLVTIKPTNLDQLPKSSPSDHGVIKKKRKISSNSSSTSDSPSKAIASQIDTIASPSKRGGSNLAPIQNSSTPLRNPDNSTHLVNVHDESGNVVARVWNSELDEMLLKSYAKFKVFKENQLLDSTSTLKNTSQNKILSRMLYNKTGILRNSKQIASRLFRLTKTKIPAASRAPLKIQTSPNNSYDDVVKTPLNKLAAARSASTTGLNNNDIDRELDQLLSSTPIDDIDLTSVLKDSGIDLSNTNISIKSDHDKQNSNILTNIDTSSVPQRNAPTESNFKLEPKLFNIQYKKDSSQATSVHHFTQLDTSYISKTPVTESNLKRKLRFTEAILTEFEKFSKTLKENELPIWYISTRFDLKSKLSQHPNQGFDSTLMFNCENGDYSSTLKIQVPVSKDDPRQFLHWKCCTYVYMDKNLLFKSTEAINGYKDNQNTKFDLHVPFLKKFWSGYLSYFNNGSYDADEVQKLFIMQVLFEDDNEDGNDDAFPNSDLLQGCLLYEFKAKGEHLGISKLNFLTLLGEDQENDDDNETVLAGSSPYRTLSPRRNDDMFRSPNLIQRRQSFQSNHLKIDTNKANLNNDIDRLGPSSAPLYNPKFNQKFATPHNNRRQMFNQTSSISEKAASFLAQTFSSNPHPNLSHSQSTGNLHDFNPHYQKQISPLANRSSQNKSSNSSSPYLANSQLGTPASFVTSTPAKDFKLSTDATGNQISSSIQRPLPPQSSMSTPLLLNKYPSVSSGMNMNPNMPMNMPMNMMNPGLPMNIPMNVNINDLDAQNLSSPGFMVNMGNNGMVNPLLPQTQYSPPAAQQTQLQHQEQQKMMMYMLQLQQQQQIALNQHNQPTLVQQKKQQSNKMKPSAQPLNHQQQQSQMMQKITAQRPFIQYPQSNNPVNSSKPKSDNKENVRPNAPMQIKFGPILGYDPSKNNKANDKSKSSLNNKAASSMSKFPVNPQVTMYDPERK